PAGTDPLLGPLANNGGPTLTYAPQVGSPVIDAGSNPAGLTTDQRGTGFARVSGLATDIGAFEQQSSTPTAARVTATAINGGVTVVTLGNFAGAEATAGSLNDGKYTLTALAGQISANGVQLDGNGDGTPGDNFVLADTGQAGGLFRLYGDSNGDRRVDNADFFQFRTTFGLPSTNPAFLAYFDVNGDRKVANSDCVQFRTRFGTSI